MTENQIKIVLKVARILAPKYRFPGYDTEDLIQECFLMMNKIMPRFDSDKSSFESFTYTHLRNRLKNFRRDNYFRPNYLCKYCGAKYNDNCKCCRRRRQNLSMKKSILCPINIDEISVDEQPVYESIDEKAEVEEIQKIINKKIPPELREDYLRLLSGVALPKARRETIENCIREIINEI